MTYFVAFFLVCSVSLSRDECDDHTARAAAIIARGINELTCNNPSSATSVAESRGIWPKQGEEYGKFYCKRIIR
jgi:hypothetical protein